MLVSKFVRGSTLIALFAAGLAACSEGPTAPHSLAVDGPEALMAKGGNSGGGSSKGAPGKDVGTRTFTIWPGAAVFEKFGDHVLFMPANVVCDPGKSSYGAEYWDAPCARVERPIQVTATWTVINRRPVISFSPDLRFAPSDDESRWVKLSLKDTKGIDPDRYYAILWFDRAQARWVDESATDPTLKARASQSGNLVTRRLKHFSDWALWSGYGSYNVTSGLGGEIGLLGGW